LAFAIPPVHFHQERRVSLVLHQAPLVRARKNLLVALVAWRDCACPSVCFESLGESAVVRQAITAGRQK
jgi:hypothetical protein